MILIHENFINLKFSWIFRHCSVPTFLCILDFPTLYDFNSWKFYKFKIFMIFSKLLCYTFGYNVISIDWIKVSSLWKFIQSYMRASSRPCSPTKSLYTAGQLRRKRGRFASRWGPLLRAHSTMQRRSSTWKVGVTLLVVAVRERENGREGESYPRGGDCRARIGGPVYVWAWLSP